YWNAVHGRQRRGRRRPVESRVAQCRSPPPAAAACRPEHRIQWRCCCCCCSIDAAPSPFQYQRKL
ncbi:hypothetical protein GGF37_004639, partial [Kickxella alabastrina]